MSAINHLISHLLEDEEDDFDLKDVTEPEELIGGPAKVTRHGRFKIVDSPGYTFLISYLTPVAYYDKTFRQYYETTKQWSPTTNEHISRWQSIIHKTPEWQNDPKNWEKSEWNPDSHYVRYPKFRRRPQAKITGLFRKLIPLFVMKPHEKRRMYHVDPKMRQGAQINKQWASGHLKHHDTGEEGLPKPDDQDYSEFFKDFEPDDPEVWGWNSGLRNQEPYERYKPDES